MCVCFLFKKFCCIFSFVSFVLFVLFCFVFRLCIVIVNKVVQFNQLCLNTKRPSKWQVNTKWLISKLGNFATPSKRIKAIRLLSNGFEYGFSDIINAPNLIQGPLQNYSIPTSQHELVDDYFIEQLTQKKLTCNNKFNPKAWIPFKVVFKGGKNRVVFDYSYPYNGFSVNDLVSDDAAYVNLPNCKNLASLVYKIGKNGFLAKTDLKSAFRQIKLALNSQSLVAYK